MRPASENNCPPLIYRVSVRTCKWPVRVSLHFLNSALKNALILYRDNAKRSGTASKDILDFMAFRLRIRECWARCIQEMEERKDLKAGAPEPPTKRRKVVQNFLPEARMERLCICHNLFSLLKAITVGSEVANPAQKLNVCRMMSPVLRATEIALCNTIKISLPNFCANLLHVIRFPM